MEVDSHINGVLFLLSEDQPASLDISPRAEINFLSGRKSQRFLLWTEPKKADATSVSNAPESYTLNLTFFFCDLMEELRKVRKNNKQQREIIIEL